MSMPPDSADAPTRPPKPKWPQRVMKVIRRIHLYLGLLLVPWVLLFGITALSFNHPTVGRSISGRLVPPEELRRLTGLRPWDPRAVAERVVADLNARGGGYTVNDASEPSVNGWPLFARPAPGGQQVVILGLDRGAAVLTQRPPAPQSSATPFEGQEVRLPGYSMADVAERLQPLHDKLGIATSGPLKPHPTVHPELRFTMHDRSGTTYNVVYDLTTGKLDGRRRDEARRGPLVEVLESLHKQHHYPASFGPTFFWALFADLTALTLVIWAVTGLIMWWQLRKLRVVGAAFLITAAILATLVMGSTAAELTFGPEGAPAEK